MFFGGVRAAKNMDLGGIRKDAALGWPTGHRAV